MEATFFTACREDAIGVHAVDDLPVEPASEPLVVPRLAAVRALAAALGVDPRAALQQFTDTTCQSFPIWSFSSDFSRALGGLDDEAIETIATAWRDEEQASGIDADLYELETLVKDLRDSLRSRRNLSERMFVLLEEKAF